MQDDIVKALQAVHSRFFLSLTILNMALVGPGLVGATLLKQVKDQKLKLKKRYNMDLRVLAISDSKKMLLSDSGALRHAALAMLRWHNCASHRTCLL